MIQQTTFSLQPASAGFHLVTREIVRQLPALPKTGLLHLFIQHTSAALTINENADPDVRIDMKNIFDRLVREREPYYQHTLEDDDDMARTCQDFSYRTLGHHPHHQRTARLRHLARHLPL